jgi:hypothetical protein
MPMLTREELRSVLVDWQSGVLLPLEVLEWSEREVALDAPTDEVTKEILSRLDILHLNLVTADDIPALLQALDFPIEQSGEALLSLKRYDESVDWEARKERYQNNPLYGPMV